MSDSPPSATPRSDALIGLIQPEWTREQVQAFLSLGLRQFEQEPVQSALTAARAQVAALIMQNEALLKTQEQAYANLQAQVADLTDERDKLRDDYDDLRAQLDRIPADLFAASGIIVGLREDLALSGQWRDMASAPKDGTRFIGKYGHLVFTTHWQAFNDFGPQKPGGGCDVIGRHFGWSHEESDRMGYLAPTAWMPLPPAPVSDQPQGE